MGWVQAGLMIASTVMSAAGDRQAGKAQSAQYQYQAEQAEADAQAEREYGINQAAKIRKAGARQLAETRASYAASGVDVTQGTPQTVNRAITQDIEEDALNAMLDGDYRAKKLIAQSQSYSASSQNALTASRINTAGTLMEGGYRLSKGYDDEAGNTLLSQGAKLTGSGWRR